MDQDGRGGCDSQVSAPRDEHVKQHLVWIDHAYIDSVKAISDQRSYPESPVGDTASFLMLSFDPAIVELASQHVKMSLNGAENDPIFLSSEHTVIKRLLSAPGDIFCPP